MATPTFSGVSLTTKAQRMTADSPVVRAHFETLPGVDGEYVQTHGQAGRTFQVAGMLEGSAQATRAAALADLRNTMDTYQGLYVGTCNTFVDTDGVSWPNCVLMSWRLSPPYYFRQEGGNFVAGGRVEAVVRCVEGP